MEQQQTQPASATSATRAPAQRRPAQRVVAPLPAAHLSSAGPFFPRAAQHQQQQQLDELLQDSPASQLAAFLVDCRLRPQNQHLNHLNPSSALHHMSQQLAPEATGQQLSNTARQQHQVNQQHLLAQQLFSTIILSSSSCWPAAAAARAAAAAAFAAATSGPTLTTTTATSSPLVTQCNSRALLPDSEATLNSMFCAEEHDSGLASAGGYSHMDALVEPTSVLGEDEDSCSEQSAGDGEEDECLGEGSSEVELLLAAPDTPQQSTIKQEVAPSDEQLINSINGASSQVLIGRSATSDPKSSPSGRLPANQLASHKSGKPRRLYKCRHCGFETEKKVENWQHIRIHMRPEKLLACGSCQFVTEYKHHLEYHQRNHSGYKPFKCHNCNYQCVNKSMLNSHMKSHSSIYLYQCGDCRYATKYVHSLKMHLRKYNHQPAQLMIDVYGRKRGPKSSSAGSPAGSPKQNHHTTVNTKAITEAHHHTSLQPVEHTSSILDLRVESKLVR